MHDLVKRTWFEGECLHIAQYVHMVSCVRLSTCTHPHTFSDDPPFPYRNTPPPKKHHHHPSQHNNSFRLPGNLHRSVLGWEGTTPAKGTRVASLVEGMGLYEFDQQPHTVLVGPVTEVV